MLVVDETVCVEDDIRSVEVRLVRMEEAEDVAFSQMELRASSYSSNSNIADGESVFIKEGLDLRVVGAMLLLFCCCCVLCVVAVCMFSSFSDSRWNKFVRTCD